MSSQGGPQKGFDGTEFLAKMQERWAAVQGADVKEHVQSAPTGGNVWGQSKLHMQASINFLQELTTKLAASAKPGGKQ